MEQPELLKHFEKHQRKCILLFFLVSTIFQDITHMRNVCATFSKRFAETPMIFAWEQQGKLLKECVDKIDVPSGNI